MKAVSPDGDRDWKRRWILPGILAAAVLARCLIESHQRLMWTDEFLTWYPVRAPFRAMWTATRADINASPPFYFVLAWGWVHLVGATATSLRILSGLSLAGAVLILHPVLRRRCGGASAVGLSLATLNPDLLGQLAQARFHMVVVLFVAAILAVTDAVERGGPTRACWFVHAALHAGLVLTSYMGAFYAAALAVGSAAGFRGVKRRSLLMSAACGWLAFLPWIPVLRRHAEIGRPTFWIPVPGLAEFTRTYVDYAGGMAIALLIGVIVLIVLGATAYRLPGGIRLRRIPSGFWWCVGAVLTVPLAAFAVSRRPGATSIYLPRYLIAGWAAAAAVLAAILDRASRSWLESWPRPARAAPLVAVLAASAVLIAGRAAVARDQPPAEGPVTTEPIVVEHVHPFMKRHMYAVDPRRYYFLLDPATAVREGGGWPGTHRFLAELKRLFPSQFPTVVDADGFLARTRSFWILRGDATWYDLRLQPDVRFFVDREYTNGAGHFLHVSRRQQEFTSAP